MEGRRTVNLLRLGWSSMKSLYYFVPFLLSVTILSGYPLPSPNSSYALRHGIRLQPEIDKIDVDAYLRNTRAVKLQVQCLIFDGPCDAVGRWIKPRVASALVGECLLCTEHQKIQLPKIMNFIQVNFPEEFKLGIKKYLFQFGIEVPSEEPVTKGTTGVGTGAEAIETTESPSDLE